MTQVNHTILLLVTQDSSYHLSQDVKIHGRAYFDKFDRTLTLKDGRDSEVTKFNASAGKLKPGQVFFLRPPGSPEDN